MNELGTWVLKLSCFTAVAAFLLIIFRKRPGVKNHPGIITGLISCSGVLLSSVLLFISLVSGKFSLEYVFHNTDRALPLIYKISAFWSGSAGSMLFWTSVFAVLLIIIYFKFMNENSTKIVFGIILIFIINFLFVAAFINNPFKYATADTDGFGLNPALQSIGMVFHPPVVIVGFCFFFMAFAYQFYDLKEKSQANRLLIWKWTIWGWILLTAGIITGGVWAYSELGWGGYWAWDPIENSSLVNWLIATAFLHNINRREPENKNRKINFTLITLTVFTILIGTFIARSGILKSVHAYSSQSMTIFFGIFLIILAAAVVIIFFKYKKHSRNDMIEGSNNSSIVSEKWYKSIHKPANMLTTLLMIMAALIFGGTIFPLFGGVFTKSEAIVPVAFYDYTFGILGLVVLLLIGVCPGMFRGKKLLLIPGAVFGIIAFIIVNIYFNYSMLTRFSLAVCTTLITNLLINIILNYKKLLSNRTYLSFFILHLSIILIAIGITGSRGMTEGTEKVLAQNDFVSIKGYTLTYQNLKWREEPGKTVAIAIVKAQGPCGRKTLKPELAYYQKKNINHSRAVIKSGFTEDLYIIFEGLDESDKILLKVMVLKWVNLVWIGGILLIIGVLMQFFFKVKSNLIITKQVCKTVKS